ncbi:NAD-dependent epimerase/dehydratase family protein [Arachnia propionica]|uniref:NAD-dependent epimerase/dehydratase family protein n=1 Tax=Arachnia propionica TaxID=1750 RepID=A0A3P1TEN1_9ACTN|nr:NAD(P)H-binding protein [Arachnia propionica]RRD07376.1 NAD-dependent epimerase/dehydratase family protein [Arachnia propionica]
MARIAVLGATGYLGGHAVTRLHADGHEVRAVVRSPKRASLPEGVEVVRGDVTESATLPASLAEVDGVLLALNGGGDPVRAVQVEERGVVNVAAAAEAAGVGRILLLSGMFAQPAYATHPWEQAEVRGEQLLLESPVPATVFRVGFINETLAKFVRGGRPVLIGRQPHPIRPIAVDDIMAAASRAIGMPRTANRVYDVAGEQAMTLREAAAAYAGAITGKLVAPRGVRVMPLWFMGAVNRLFLKGEMTRPLGILASMNRHGDVTATTDCFRDFGIPPTPFAQWIAQQRAIASEGSS